MIESTRPTSAEPHPASVAQDQGAMSADLGCDVELATDISPSKADELADVPPDGGYGWVCVGCSFMINAHSWGLNSVGSQSVQPWPIPDLTHRFHSPTASFSHITWRPIRFLAPNL